MNSYILSLILLIMGSCFCAVPAGAQQVTNFDTAYPLTPANKIILEESLKGPSEHVEIKLKGRIMASPEDTYFLTKPTLIRLGPEKKKRADDGVRGKTLYINQGFGGAILY